MQLLTKTIIFTFDQIYISIIDDTLFSCLGNVSNLKFLYTAIRC